MITVPTPFTERAAVAELAVIRGALAYVREHAHDRDALAAERRARFKLATGSATAPERHYHQQRLDAYDQALSEAGITIEGD